MKKKTSIANKTRYKKKSFENSSVSRTVTDYEKRKVNRNKNDSGAVHEILAIEKLYRKSEEINSISSSSNDDWTLKQPYSSDMKRESENLYDINKRTKIKNENNILIENNINERQNQDDISNIKQFKKYIIFKMILIELSLIIGTIQYNIQFLYNELGINDILQTNITYLNKIIFILASSLFVNEKAWSNFFFI